MTSLSELHGVLQELEDLRAGFLYSDHLFGQIVDDIRDKKEVWEIAQAEAAKLARADAPKAATATELNALVTQHVNSKPSARKARDEFRAAEDRKAKLERWIRSNEQRLKAAQTAKGIHEQLAQGGGG